MTAKNHIGNNIKLIRQLRGLKQSAIGSEIRMIQTRVSQLEQSVQLPKELLNKIASVLGVSAKAIENFDRKVLLSYIDTVHDVTIPEKEHFQFSKIAIKSKNLSIGQKIAKARLISGLSQIELGKRLRISKQAISRLEQADTLTDNKLQKVATALGVNASFIKRCETSTIFYFIENINTYSPEECFGSTTLTVLPMDKVVELYERLLNSEREMNSILKAKLATFTNTVIA
jgi:transcriptional regulator with XRE-family HTH domain